MPVEFAYAQARAQARHGRRLSADTWSLLESSVGLSQFLHQVRGTALAPRVEHFSASSSPHVIERFLRCEWHEEVDSAVHWVPARWRAAVAWTSGLAELPATRYLQAGGEPQGWMAEDAVLSKVAAGETTAASGSGLAGWLRHWRTLWPEQAADDPVLKEFLSLIRKHAIRDEQAEAGDWRETLEHRAVRILRRHREQPVTVFCHLLLCALELHRLRQGLLQRALFNDLVAEVAA
jgi:hypothetical protein